MLPPIKNIIVLGAGTMGQGIAQWFAQQQFKVALIDSFPQQLEKGRSLIHESWKKLGEKKKFTQDQIEDFKKNIYFTSHLDDLQKNPPDFIIEAIFEEQQTKVELFQKIIKILPQPCLMASNTSGISISALAQTLPAEWKSLFFGLHFFNPAPLMPLVEIIHTPWVTKEFCMKMSEWITSLGKRPVICKDRPGFIVNRLNRNFYGEPMRIAQNHQEELLKEIDQTIKEVGGFKMGPFELMDMIGIDINFQVTSHLWKCFFYEPRFAPHLLQADLVESGRLGKKTGEGFFQYE